MALVTNVIKGSRSTRLAMLLQGYGADVLDLGAVLSLLDPDGTLAVVMPRAPYEVPGTPGYSWYGMLPEEEGQGDYDAALDSVDDLFQEQCVALGFYRAASI